MLVSLEKRGGEAVVIACGASPDGDALHVDLLFVATGVKALQTLKDVDSGVHYRVALPADAVDSTVAGYELNQRLTIVAEQREKSNK